MITDKMEPSNNIVAMRVGIKKKEERKELEGLKKMVLKRKWGENVYTERHPLVSILPPPSGPENAERVEEDGSTYLDT